MRSMRAKILAGTAFVVIATAGGCGKSKTTTTGSASGRQATVTLTDGSGFAGTVTNSSNESITLTAPNGETRTYPMTQVASVQYSSAPADATPAQVGSNPPADATPAPPAAASSLPPAEIPPANPPASGTAHNVPPPAGARTVSNVPPPASYPSAPVAAQPAPVRQAAAPPPAPLVRTVPAGSRLVVRNNELIDSKVAAPGQTYSGVVEESVVDTAGRVVIPRGSPATLVVRSATDQGKMQGQSELALDIDAVSVAGRRYRVETTDIVKKGTAGFGENKRTGVFLGGGTALGALLGAVAGGGRGAAIGAVSGAAAGTATQAVTRGHGVKVPAETLMTFRLEAPVRVREVR